MKVEDLETKKPDKYIVLIPTADQNILEGIKYSFDNVIYLDFEPTVEDAKTLINYINSNDNVKELIVFDYHEFYRQILPEIKRKKEIKWILKNNFASLTKGKNRDSYRNMYEFYKRKIVSSIGVLDKETYEVFKNAGYNVNLIYLDIEKEKMKDNSKSNSIGLIGDDYNPNHNIYNELSAIKLIKDYSFIKMIRCMPATEHFISYFGIKEKHVDTLSDAMRDNYVNLYCNFTSFNTCKIIKSFDMGVPVILGNTSIFDDYKLLKAFLVLKSDDDISEIANKIDNTKDNYKKIFDEYNKFRSDYSKKSKESIKKFLNS